MSLGLPGEPPRWVLAAKEFLKTGICRRNRVEFSADSKRLVPLAGLGYAARFCDSEGVLQFLEVLDDLVERRILGEEEF